MNIFSELLFPKILPFFKKKIQEYLQNVNLDPDQALQFLRPDLVCNVYQQTALTGKELRQLDPAKRLDPDQIAPSGSHLVCSFFKHFCTE